MFLFEYTEVAFWTFVLGGLGLFLYGIVSLSRTLKKAAGGKLKKFLSKCSNNPVKGMLVGAGFTSIIQSSSGTTALTVGLVRAGILTFIEAAGIIIGANIGTTITAFIISIPILEYMPLVLFVGSLILLVTTKNKWENAGEIFFALGSIFFGLWIIGMNLKSLSDAPWFTDVFIALNNSPFLGLLVGVLSATIFQSSSAVIGVLQGIYAVAAPETISLFGIIPIVLGANIGTTFDAVIAAIGGSKDAKRIALFHVIFNLTGAIIFMSVDYAAMGFLKGSATWALDPKLQIAICHLAFNLCTALVFLPLLKPINKLCCFLIKGNDNKHEAIVIKELDTRAMKEFPAAGIDIAKSQVNDMFNYVGIMFNTISEYLAKRDDEDGEYVLELEESVDKIDRQLNEYLLLPDKGDLSDEELYNFSIVLRGCKDIERLGDYGENLINFYSHAKERKLKFEGYLFEKIGDLHKMAIDLVRKTQDAYINVNKEEALQIIDIRRQYVKKADEILDDYFNSIDEKTTEKVSYINLVFADIVSDYQRIYSHCSNIAKLFNHDKTYIPKK